MGPPPRLEPPVSRRVRKRYLLRDERVVVSTRWHWAKLLGPAVAVFVALFLTLWIAASTTDMAATGMALCVFAVVCAWAGWKVLEWRCEWFIATDRRLLKTYGLITQRVAMMPLVKVTDMSYDRSIVGRMLGYGQFVMESAGQDQALSHIDYIPDPDEKYHAMCETIFGRDLRDPGEDDDGREDDHRPERRRPARRSAERQDWRSDDPEAWAGPSDPSGRDDHDEGDDDEGDDLGAGDEQGDGAALGPARPRPPRRRDGTTRWESVEREELPADWDWVDERPLPRRATPRRRVAIDPDPTPLR